VNHRGHRGHRGGNLRNKIELLKFWGRVRDDLFFIFMRKFMRKPLPLLGMEIK
jgi:hypothetical protein